MRKHFSKDATSYQQKLRRIPVHLQERFETAL